MPNRSAITLLNVRGIRIGVDYSWFIVLFLVILWLSGFYKDVLGTDDNSLGPYALAVASALLFFASILLHELGHAFVAVRKGIGISGITLWMFGGVARMERDTDSPGTEFKVAIAGPLVTAAIFLVCAAIFWLSGESWGDFKDSAATDNNAQVSGAMAMVGWLGGINFIVLFFNLIPAYPLDGGRIARAIAWWRTGDRTKATRFAAALGQGFAYILIGLGLFWILQGDLIGGMWMVLIGFILNGSARGAVIQSEFTQSIEGLQVADIMDREPVAVPAELNAERALDEYFLRYRWPWFPVVDADGRFRGLVELGSVQNVPEVERASTEVSSLVAQVDEESNAFVRQDDPLEAVLGNQTLRRLGALAAVDADGRLRGMLTADAVGRALKGTEA